MTVVGATMKLGLAWDLSDTFNGLMMIPNLIGVLALSGTVVDITRNYFARRVRGEDIEPMWSLKSIRRKKRPRLPPRSGAGEGRKQITQKASPRKGDLPGLAGLLLLRSLPPPARR